MFDKNLKKRTERSGIKFGTDEKKLRISKRERKVHCNAAAVLFSYKESQKENGKNSSNFSSINCFKPESQKENGKTVMRDMIS